MTVASLPVEQFTSFLWTLLAYIPSLLAFFILLSFLILIHEFGHFFAARRSKVVVEEFGFGLPPRMKTLFWQGGTRFSFNWIPFGGFVRLQGENAATEKERKARGSFGGASILSRILILVAGVGMNLLLALVIFTFGFSWGQWIPRYLSLEDMKAAATRGEISLVAGVRIADVREGGTALDAGVMAGSMLLAVNGEPVYGPQEILAVQESATEVTYSVREADGTERTLNVPVEDGKTGVELQFSPEISSPRRSVGMGFLLALREAKNSSVQTVLGMGQLFRSLVQQARVPEGVTGIVGIAVLTYDTVQMGIMPYVRLLADLSLSLAILNILPFPALDGGRLVFVLYEFVRRRPAPRTLELTTNALGFVFLIGLILVITYNDILQLF